MRAALTSSAVAVFFVAGIVAAGASAGPPRLRVDSPEIPRAARGLAPGGGLTIEGVPLETEGAGATLVLERFRVFAPDARIVVRSTAGERVEPPPANVYLRGDVAGRAGSMVLLTVRATGGMRGLVVEGGRFWVLAGGKRAGGPVNGLAVREIDAATELVGDLSAFRCSTGDLWDRGGLIEQTLSAPPARPTGAGPEGTTYHARVAVETDFEFYQLFGSVPDATDYIGDIIAYNSVLYAQVDTSMTVAEIFLWESAADPWDESSAICLLYEFGKYWNVNRDGVDRTVAHFMSGRTSNSGVAWVGVLCEDEFNVDTSMAGCSFSDTSNYGGDYGFSGGLDGDFDINNPAVIWDIVVTAHELGHNFGSMHTHCYAGVLGNPNQIDECYNGQCGQGACHCGGTSLPAGCPGTGQGCGTLMSYCHLYSGGGNLGNISFFFGSGQPYGTAPGRVNTVMLSELASAAAGDPACLAPIGEIFSDGFESGDTSAWSAAVP